MNLKAVKDQDGKNWNSLRTYRADTEKISVGERQKKEKSIPNLIGKMKHSGKPLLLNDNPPNIRSTEMALKANPKVIESKYEKLNKEYWNFDFNNDEKFHKLRILRSDALNMLEEMRGDNSYLYKTSDKKKMIEILKNIDRELTRINNQ